MKKKLTAMMMALALIIGVTSCASQEDKQDLINSAEEFCSGVKNLKVTKIKDFVGDDKNTDEILEKYIHGEGLTDSRLEVYELVLDSISYELDEKSAKCDKKAAEGSIDVTFEIVDYESVTEDEAAVTGLDSFYEALEDCDDTAEYELTLEMYYDGENWVVDNYGEVFEELFDDIRDFEVNFVPDLTNQICEAYWSGDCDDSGLFTNAVFIEYELIMGEDFDSINYYYEFSTDGEVFYTSEVRNSFSGVFSAYIYSDKGYHTPLDDSGSFIAPGTYQVNFYDDMGNSIYTAECNVVVEEVELPTDLSETVESTTWNYPGDGVNTFANITSVFLSINVKDEYKDAAFNYFYTVEYNDEVIYTSDEFIRKGFSEKLYYGSYYNGCPVDENNSDNMAEGIYTFKVYSIDGKLITQDSCNVLCGDDVILLQWQDGVGYQYAISQDSYRAYFIKNNYTADGVYYDNNGMKICVETWIQIDANDKYTYEVVRDDQSVGSGDATIDSQYSDRIYIDYQEEIQSGSYEVTLYNNNGIAFAIIKFVIE